MEIFKHWRPTKCYIRPVSEYFLEWRHQSRLTKIKNLQEEFCKLEATFNTLTNKVKDSRETIAKDSEMLRILRKDIVETKIERNMVSILSEQAQKLMLEYQGSDIFILRFDFRKSIK